LAAYLITGRPTISTAIRKGNYIVPSLAIDYLINEAEHQIGGALTDSAKDALSVHIALRDAANQWMSWHPGMHKEMEAKEERGAATKHRKTKVVINFIKRMQSKRMDALIRRPAAAAEEPFSNSASIMIPNSASVHDCEVLDSQLETPQPPAPAPLLEQETDPAPAPAPAADNEVLDSQLETPQPPAPAPLLEQETDQAPAPAPAEGWRRRG